MLIFATEASEKMRDIINDFQDDAERARYLEGMLVNQATGGGANNIEYQKLRHHFIQSSSVSSLLPSFVRSCRDLTQFWQFIKRKFDNYAERREFIWGEFSELIDYLEGRLSTPADTSISEGLKNFDSDEVQAVWQKALDRRHTDPEGAITIARTLLETICKHILDDLNVTYNSKNAEMHELYKHVASELNLSTDQHSENIFKQILGGCSAIINGLGTLRNKLGDAHGQGKAPIKPAPRHAELAVNLSGTMAIFLINTWNNQKGKSGKK